MQVIITLDPKCPRHRKKTTPYTLDPSNKQCGEAEQRKDCWTEYSAFWQSTMDMHNICEIITGMILRGHNWPRCHQETPKISQVLPNDHSFRDGTHDTVLLPFPPEAPWWWRQTSGCAPLPCSTRKPSHLQPSWTLPRKSAYRRIYSKGTCLHKKYIFEAKKHRILKPRTRYWYVGSFRANIHAWTFFFNLNIIWCWSCSKNPSQTPNGWRFSGEQDIWCWKIARSLPPAQRRVPSMCFVPKQQNIMHIVQDRILH